MAMETRFGTIVKVVYWSAGMVADHSKNGEMVPEWHFHSLDADGYVISHGDNYLSEEDVVRACEGTFYDVPIEEGFPGTVHPEDEAVGKKSANDQSAMAPFSRGGGA